MQCLNERQLKMYFRGALPADEMVAAGEHVHECTACRASVAATKEFQSAAWSMENAVLAALCPEYEELSSFVDEGLSHEAHQSVERHISVCDLCWHDVQTLQEARSRASLAPRITVLPGQFAPRKRGFAFGWQRAGAAVAGVAVAAVVFFGHVAPTAKQPKPVQVAVKPPTVAKPAPVAPKMQPIVVAATPGRIAAKSPIGVKPVIAAPAGKPVVVAELTDGGVTVGRSNGQLKAQFDGRDLEAQVARIVAKKLKDGKVPPSFRISSLPDSLRGPANIIDIKKLSPPSGAVVNAAPEFRWEPVDGASKYRVEVYTLDGTPVLAAETETTNYRADQNLRGGSYKWVVRVRRGELAEWKWSRAASFRVLSIQEISLISRVKREYPGSHLALGSVYESLGLGREAIAQFEALAAESPGSPLAAKLLAGAKANARE